MNIQAVARRTGIPSATLRKWEQRYGVLKPERTAGSHRRYSERDVLRVEWLKARLAEGFRIGEAARLLGGDGAGVATDVAGLREEIVAAAVAPDAGRIVHALDQSFSLYPPADAIVQVIDPALERMGELWSSGEVTVALEHQLSELVRAKLRGLLNGTVRGPRGGAVLCCVPGERHELGLLSLAVLMNADGWSVAYLGADTPLANAAELADSIGAHVLCVSATMAENAHAAGDELAALEEGFPNLTIVRGGFGFGHESPIEATERLRTLGAR